MELQPTDRIHFIGIGGVSMSALAHALADQGYVVSGSDRSDSPVLQALRQAGVTVHVGHAAGHVAGGDVVIYNTAIRGDNPELAAARQAGLRVHHRSEMLAWMLRGKQGIAVTGTHGKTTTSAMIAVILQHAGRDPSGFIGGLVHEWQGNYCLGQGPQIVFEACESDGTFLRYVSCSQVVTGIEDDHLDQHQSSARLDAAFAAFLRSADPQGFVVWYRESERLARIIGEAPARLISYGEAAGADYRAQDVDCAGAGTTFTVVRAGRAPGQVRLPLPGRHNALNALAAIAAAEALGVDFGDIAAALQGFRGTGRRFELLGQGNGIAVYDDYAHHPTEVRATLAAARGFGAERIIAIFQPHLYSRTQRLMTDFAAAFEAADVVIINAIYAAREEPIPGVEGDVLADHIRRQSGEKSVCYLAAQEDIVARVGEMARAGDLVLTIGAGDIRQAGEALAERLTGA
jgi:UDP-N-acetylmuramate--alanine ligase